ncbi:MAG: Rpn family recombination-promoting nuclease/putative transposase [Nitrospirae bacterium]|nr:Rpn family recombination-promoting nuclease/putative transposase [Magnetococcales bacterium]HAT50320.1 hypothetical protein [Alphaproteobacteria bacterium]
MADHDGLYHQLYTHPHMMADLLRQFVTEPWVADLDLSGMEPVKTKFHVPGLPKRESDVVWRIPIRSGSEIYLLVLLEFQSESDRWMILRVQVYMCLLWLQLLHEKKIPASGPLPPLFPVVLHNGDTPWLMPVRMHDLIDLPLNSPLWPYQPGGQFFLIDEGRYPKKNLENRDSLSALVFMIEQCTNPENLPALAESVIQWLEKHAEFAELRQVLAAMLFNAMTTLSKDQTSRTDHNPINLMEVPTMLQTRMETWKKQWTGQKEQELIAKITNELYAKVTQELFQKGERKNAEGTFHRLLHKKFGPGLSPHVEEKLRNATLEAIEAWTDRILDAQNLSDVFKE